MTERERVLRLACAIQKKWETGNVDNWTIRARIARIGIIEEPGWYMMEKEKALDGIEQCYLGVLPRKCLGRDFVSDDYIFKALRIGWIFGTFAWQNWVTLCTLDRVMTLKKMMVKGDKERIENVFDPSYCGYVMACRAWDTDVLGHDGELLSMVHSKAFERLETMRNLGIEVTAVCDEIQKWIKVPLFEAEKVFD